MPANVIAKEMIIIVHQPVGVSWGGTSIHPDSGSIKKILKNSRKKAQSRNKTAEGTRTPKSINDRGMIPNVGSPKTSHMQKTMRSSLLLFILAV
jgi:hypothetical protein